MTELRAAGVSMPELPPQTQPFTPLDRDRREGDDLLLHDLLLDFDELKVHLSRQLAGRKWLDAYLLAAGMNQVVEDFLHRDIADLERVERTLAHAPRRFAGLSERPVRWTRRVGLLARAASRRERDLVRWQRRLEMAVGQLAAAACDRPGENQPEPSDSITPVLDSQPPAPRALRRAVIRLPTCFRSLDQKPEDLRRIVEDFLARHPDRGRPLLVVGLRTSGSYLAPIYAHFLMREGYRDVDAMTMRPGQRMLSTETKRIERCASRGGMVLMTDDPPKTGSSLLRTASLLESLGLGHESIKLLVPLLDKSELPIPLQRYECFVLQWAGWEVQRLLSARHLEQTLRDLLEGRTISPADGDGEPIVVDSVERVETLDIGPRSDLKAGSPVRRHVRSLVRVTLRDRRDGRQLEHLVYVKGVGLGFFGRHSVAVARRLADFLPELYGVRDGLLFRAWLPESRRISRDDRPPRLARRIAEYVFARNTELRAEEDKSLRTVGLNPLWQRTADLLGTAFGRQRSLFRPVLHASARKLLDVQEPSVVDGSMALGQWFCASSAPGSRVVKVDYDERAFSNQDTVIDQLYSYDPVFDLAAAAADFELDHQAERPDDGFHDELVAAYESQSGIAIPGERWLLYQLIHHSSHRRFVESLRSEVEVSAIPADGFENLTVDLVSSIADRAAQASARADQRYLARTLLDGVASPPHGPLCAIDLDGVLETGWFGYSSATRAGVLALRRLMRHGFRPVLATGRSLGDVIDRCRTLRLAGGVAEYGAVIYDHRDHSVIDLVGEAELEGIDRIRTLLQEMDGVHVERAYRRIVRASRVRRGSRAPLDPTMLAGVLEALGVEHSVRVVNGYAQTDILPAGIDKGRGVRALADRLVGSRRNPAMPPLAFAIGDSYSDLALLAEASARYAPANADQAVMACGAAIMKRSHQGGLGDAVSNFLGHEPRTCPECRAPAVAGQAQLLLTAFSAGGATSARKLGVGLRLALHHLR